jgi:hypothetical protein
MGKSRGISSVCRCKGHVDPCKAHGSEAHPPELIDLVHEHDGYSLIGL